MRILFLGIGNNLCADGGVGVFLANYLQEHFQFSHPLHQLDIIAGANLNHEMVSLIAKYDQLIICDMINPPGSLAGEVYFFDFDAAPPAIDWQGSSHEVEILQTLTMMNILGNKPHTYVLGLSPQSPEHIRLPQCQNLLAARPLMERAILTHLTSLGFKCHRPIEAAGYSGLQATSGQESASSTKRWCH